MKFSIKVLAASALIAVAGSSQAAILDGYANPGDGDIFISILRDSATPQSMIIDTNISIFDLRDGVTTNWTASAAQTAAVLNFLGTSDLSDFRFNAGGVSDQFDIFDPTMNDDLGAVVSSNDAFDSQILDSSNVDTVRQNIHGFETEINNVYPSPANDVITGLSPSSQANGAGFHNSALWGDHVGGALPSINTAAAAGTPLDLWYLYNGSSDFLGYTTSYLKLGQFSIDTATGVISLSPVSSVPVPAAIWLLGSGLVGLVGVARRKAA